MAANKLAKLRKKPAFTTDFKNSSFKVFEASRSNLTVTVNPSVIKPVSLGQLDHAMAHSIIGRSYGTTNKVVNTTAFFNLSRSIANHPDMTLTTHIKDEKDIYDGPS